MSGSDLFKFMGSEERLVDRVAQEIQGLIVSGQLKPGVKLPPQRELAEQIGVSRTVLREAVHILVTKGLLATQPGVGTVVREMSAHQIAEPLSLLLQIRGICLEDLHRVRKILELEIAEMASFSRTEQDIDQLRQILAEMEVAKDDPEAFAGLDAAFHQVLAHATNNPLLGVLLESIRDVTLEVRLAVHRHPDLSETAIRDHRDILDQLIRRDLLGARKAMERHLEHARSIQEELFGWQTAQGST